METLNGGGVRHITVVRGYRKHMVNLPSVEVVDNDDFETSGEAATLACAADRLDGGCLVVYGDILFRQYILDQLLAADGDIVLVVDAMRRDRDPDPSSHVRDLVSCSAPFGNGYLEDGLVTVRRIGHDLAAADIDGEWIGLARLNQAGAAAVRAALDDMANSGALTEASLIDLFGQLIAAGQSLEVLYITGHWLDVDNAADLAAARSFL